jgi:hypothetical protein
MTWGWARRCRLTAHKHRRTAAPRRTTPHHAAPRRTTPHHAAPRGTTPHHAAPRRTTPHHAAPRRTTQHRSTAAPQHRSSIVSPPCLCHVRAAGADHRLPDGRARQARQLGGPRAALPTPGRRPPASARGGADEHAIQLAARIQDVGLLPGTAVPWRPAGRRHRAGEGRQMRRAAHDVRHDPQKRQGSR